MGTPTMIDNVAKAIANANSRDVNPNWRMWREHARAAIEAMREPTPEMLKAAREAPMPLPNLDSISARCDLENGTHWRAMINTALNETPS